MSLFLPDSDLLAMADRDAFVTPDDHGSRPIRVLHVINGEHFAGAERVQDLLALRLPAHGVTADFACLKPNRFPAARKSRQATVYSMPMRNRFDLRPALKLARLVRQQGYALLHTHTPRAAMVGRIAAAFSGVPMIHHVHGQTATEVGQHWRSRINAAIERFTLRGAAAVIAVSPSAGRYITAQGVSAGRVRIVCNGVPARDELAPKATPQNSWTLGVIALFRPRKGLEPLLEALSLLRKQGLPIRLRAVGSFETTEYERSVRRLAAELKIEEWIEWTGFRSDVNGELDQMDLLAFPSVLAEGLPMVVIEAMAAGVPVVGTRVDGVIDVIRDGVDGLLCEPNDARSLADAVARFSQGAVAWQRLRAAAWERQREQFSDSSMARSMAELYRNVLAERGKSSYERT